MGFTTNTFLFLFLPLTILSYFAFYRYMQKRDDYTIGNIIISITSLIFYSWALDTNAIMLFLYTVILFMFGKIIDLCRYTCISIPYFIEDERKEKRVSISTVLAIVGVIATILLLIHFKYMSSIAPMLSKYFYIDASKYEDITVPLGISFITFSSISYLLDINASKATSGSFLDCFVYLFFFPKIVSGPIVKWKDFEPQVKHHPTNTDEFVYGINRIIIGFAKKIILADTFGVFVKSINHTQIDAITSCMGWLAYALQIYYDFSGYSDIAIGLSRIFGIRFDENFRFPYRSTSITEFWRRWHISLGAFFKEYVYIPLGGNRKGIKRTLINLAIVFVVTGIWHGAGMAFILWGLLHGICILLERMIREKPMYKRIPILIKWFITFVVVASLWQLFRFGNVKEAIVCFRQMMGMYSYSYIEKTWEFYASNRLITFLLIGFIGSTLIGNQKLQNLYKSVKNNYLFYITQETVLFGLFIISIAFMINSTYSPFIYFQF